MKKVALYLDNLDEDYQISIYREIKKKTLERGITLLCIQGGTLSSIKNFTLDGVILLSSVLKDVTYTNYDIPTVSIGTIIPGLPSVLVNSRNSMTELMLHLVNDHKYRTFLYVGGPKNHHDNLEREEAFISVLNNSDVPEISYDVINGEFYQNSGIMQMKGFISKYPDKNVDIIVCASDHLALGVKKAIDLTKNNNWKGVYITGFDDITSREMEFPGLTSIKQPLEEISEQVLDSLDKMFKGETPEQISFIDSKPVYRTSCGCKNSTYPIVKQQSIEQYSLTISYFGQSLTRVESYNELLEHLKGLLQMFNINEYYLLLEKTSETYNLIYNKRGESEEINLENENTIKLTDIFNSTIPTTYIIYHLISGTGEIGMVIYKCDDDIVSHMCTSSAFMTNAVKQLIMLEMEKKRSMLLEVEVNRRTADLIQINRALEREINRRVEVEAEVLRISEMERKRFSLDLHDDICQRLAGISMYAKSFPDSEDLKELTDLIDDTLHRTRHYAHNSFPMELNSLGIKRSIEELCYTIQKQSGIEVIIDWDDYNFTTEQQINIFRITQEAVQNTIKHSNASKLVINGLLQQNNYEISIMDNGDGKMATTKEPKLNQLKRERPKGLGLKSMEYRAHQINATYSFTSKPGVGTTIILVVPV